MNDYEDFASRVAEARRLRDEAVGEYLAAGWHALAHGVHSLVHWMGHRIAGKGHDVPPPVLHV